MASRLITLRTHGVEKGWRRGDRKRIEIIGKLAIHHSTNHMALQYHTNKFLASLSLSTIKHGNLSPLSTLLPAAMCHPLAAPRWWWSPRKSGQPRTRARRGECRNRSARTSLVWSQCGPLELWQHCMGWAGQQSGVGFWGVCSTARLGMKRKKFQHKPTFTLLNTCLLAYD